MHIPLYFLAFVGLMVQPVLAHAGDSSPRLHVGLKAHKAAVVLGEPLLMTVTVTNTGKEPIESKQTFLQEDGADPEIRVYISKGISPFEEYEMAIFPIVFAARKTEILEPGMSRDYELRVLYTPRRPGRLALYQPGEWSIKVKYRLVWHDPSGRVRGDDYHSNVIQIKVSEAVLTDKDVWKRVRQPRFLSFLQSGCELNKPKQNVPRVVFQALELLKQYPDSSYHAAIRWALQEYYDTHRPRMTYLEAQKSRELSAIRSALGIDEPPPGPFPDDARLDVIVTERFPQVVPLWFVLEELSLQARVPLSAAPKLAERKCGGLDEEVTRSLREVMDGWDNWDAEWVPHGNGYQLVPAPIPPELLKRLHDVRRD